MKNSNEKKKDIPFQTFSAITIAGLASAAVEAIVGYMAVYFFSPLWNFLIKKLTSKNDKRDVE